MINKNYKKINKILNISIVLIALFIFLVLAYDVSNDYITKFDNYFYDLFMVIKSSYVTTFFKIITHFGSAVFLILLSVLLCFFIKNKKINILIFINLVLSFLLNFLFKQLFARTRPIDINLIIEDGYSFPSGHAMVSFAFYGFLIYLIYRYVKKEKLKHLLMVILAVIICLVSISRVYLGVHFSSDVLAGIILGFLYLVLFVYIINKKIKMNS